MSARKETTQLVSSFTVPREEFLGKVVGNRNLKKHDYIVLMFLLTQLDGWNSTKRMLNSVGTLDPQNFRKIDVGNASNTLGLRKSDIRLSISKLEKEGILEMGSSPTVKRGYRFTF